MSVDVRKVGPVLVFIGPVDGSREPVTAQTNVIVAEGPERTVYLSVACAPGELVTVRLTPSDAASLSAELVAIASKHRTS